MIDILLCLVFEVLGQIDHLPVWSKIAVSKVVDPAWNGGGEKEELGRSLGALFDLPKYLVNIFLESHIQHLVCLIKDHCF